jgi:hypothetical protein
MNGEKDQVKKNAMKPPLLFSLSRGNMGWETHHAHCIRFRKPPREWRTRGGMRESIVVMFSANSGESALEVVRYSLITEEGSERGPAKDWICC